MSRTLLVAAALSMSDAFTVTPSSGRSLATELHMGLFDGVKEAFSAPALQRSTLDAERETPIDRWMGWSVASENQQQQNAAKSAVPANFVDSMDESNYIAVDLTKPMGIVFEENDSDFGGIFVQSLKEGGAAAVDGTLQESDQLVAVNTVNVAGMVFDDALGAIVASEGDATKLVLFRGGAKQLYGPTGASKDWLAEFIAKGGVKAAEATKEPPAAVEATKEPPAAVEATKEPPAAVEATEEPPAAVEATKEPPAAVEAEE